MTVLWAVAVASAVLALVAWRKARAAAQRLEQLSQMYWELKYQHGELRVQLHRLTGGEPHARADVAPPPADRPAAVIPLSSLKR